MTDKLAFDVGLQEDATGVGLEGTGGGRAAMGRLQAGAGVPQVQAWRWGGRHRDALGTRATWASMGEP